MKKRVQTPKGHRRPRGIHAARRKGLQVLWPCRASGLLGLSFGILLFLAAAVGQAAEPKAPATRATSVVHTTSAALVPAAIPIAEVAARATEASSFLSNLYTQFSPGDDIEKIEKELPDLGSRMAMELRRTTKFLQTQPTLDTLQSAQRLWHIRQTEIGKWLVYLTQRATQLQAALNQLEDLQKRWGLTLDTARKEQAPATVIQQVSALLPAIDAAQRALQEQSSAVLDLQGRVAKDAAQCGKALTAISQAQQAAVGKMASRQRLPIWSAELWKLARAQGFSRLDKIAAAPWEDIKHYLSRPDGGMPAHLAFFGVLFGLFLWMRRKVRRWPTGEGTAVIATVIDRPFAAAVIGALLYATSPYSPEPPTIRNLLSVLAVAAMIRLMEPSVDQQMVAKLYALGILFAIDTVRHTFSGAHLLDQVLLIVEALAGMAVLTKSLTHWGLWRPSSRAPRVVRLRAFRAGTGLVVLVLLGAGLAAGAMGYMKVARLLVSGILYGGALALTLSATIRILHAVTAFGLRVRPLKLLRSVGHHRVLLERRIQSTLTWVAIVVWSMRVLDYVGMYQPVLSVGKAVLAAKLERGSISLSLEDVLAFVLTVWAAFLLSAFIRFVLEEDVYTQRKVPEGFAYATSRLLHYLILTVGFVMGMGVLGADLTKVTVLLGAFGVGIGFGLQSVVNNFVSGLILLFERPIHLGDTLELGKLLGQVRRIGIRASVVRTRQGAEIIVPNSQLISDQVTNWTLSDQLRRLELAVGVNYDADPNKVIEVLKSVAAANPRVLKHPPPKALLVGFGDSTLNFQLRAWTDQFVDWTPIKSELAVAVYDAVHGAGFSFPFPQREVRLLRDNEA